MMYRYWNIINIDVLSSEPFLLDIFVLPTEQINVVFFRPFFFFRYLEKIGVHYTFDLG